MPKPKRVVWVCKECKWNCETIPIDYSPVCVFDYKKANWKRKGAKHGTEKL
jgi:hypothetical protein